MWHEFSVKPITERNTTPNYFQHSIKNRSNITSPGTKLELAHTIHSNYTIHSNSLWLNCFPSSSYLFISLFIFLSLNVLSNFLYIFLHFTVVDRINKSLRTASPDTYKVVDAIVDALTSQRPQTRYVVGLDAKVIVFISYLPTFIVDPIFTRLRQLLVRD